MLIVVLGVAAVANMFADYAGAIFRGLERLRDEAVLNTVRAVLVTAAALVGLVGLYAGGRSAIGLAVGMAAGSLVSAGYGPVAGLEPHRRAGGRPVAARRRRGDSGRRWSSRRRSGSRTLLGLLYFKIDVLLVRAIAGDAQLGTYSAAYKVFEAAAILPTIVMAAGLPPLARAHRDPARRRHWERLLAGMLLAMGGLVAAVAYGARRPIVALLFGADFVAAVPSLGIIAAAIPLSFLNAGSVAVPRRARPRTSQRRGDGGSTDDQRRGEPGRDPAAGRTGRGVGDGGDGSGGHAGVPAGAAAARHPAGRFTSQP